MAVIGLTAWLIVADRAVELARARDQTAVMARTLEEHVRASVSALDLLLREHVSQIQARGGLSRFPALEMHKIFNRQMAHLPQLLGLFAYGPDSMIYTTGVRPDPPLVDGSKLDHILHHRDNPGSMLYFGEQGISPVSGNALIPLTLRIPLASGGYGGVIGAAIDPHYFEKFYKSLGLGTGATLGLLRPDGRVLVRFPVNKDLLGRDVSASPLFKDGINKADVGTLTFRTIVDDQVRIASYRKLAEFPIVVVVTLNKEVVLAHWRDAAMVNAAAAGSALLALSGLLLFTLRLVERSRFDNEQFEQSRIAASRSLNEADERYRLLVEASPMGLLVHDRGLIEYANDRAAQILGEPAASVLVGRSANDYLHLDDQGEWGASNAELSEYPNKLARQVFRVIRRDGREILVESSSTSSLQGGRVLTQVVLRDVTEERGADAALRASEERLVQVVAVSPVGIAIIDMDSRKTLQINPAFEKISGHTNADLQGLTARDFNFWIDRDDTRWFQRLESTGMAGPADFRYRHKSGREGFAVLTSHVIQFQGVRRAVVFVQDLTERKIAEQSLLESETKFREVFQNASDAMWIVDVVRDGRMTYGDWNSLYAATIHATSRDLTGLTPHDLFPTATADLITARWAECARTGQAVSFHFSHSAEHSDRYLSVFLVPLKDSSGRTVRIAGVARDLTEKKRAEDEIRALNESLEVKIRARTADMEAAYRELESFSYSVSHDLRAPARAVVGFSQIIIEEHGAELDAETRRLLDRIVAAGARMSELTDGLLVLTHLSRREMQRQPVDLSVVAAMVIEELREASPAREVNVVIQPGLNANADAHMVRSVLQNLLGNAWKYSSRTPDAKIEFSAIEDDGERVFVVRDNGAGFDMKYADKLFGVFQRLHSAVEFEGTGIGLATVERIIRRHGGRIRAEARVGLGASFYFTVGELPAGGALVKV